MKQTVSKFGYTITLNISSIAVLVTTLPLKSDHCIMMEAFVILKDAKKDILKSANGSKDKFDVREKKIVISYM